MTIGKQPKLCRIQCNGLGIISVKTVCVARVLTNNPAKHKVLLLQVWWHWACLYQELLCWLILVWAIGHWTDLRRLACVIFASGKIIASIKLAAIDNRVVVSTSLEFAASVKATALAICIRALTDLLRELSLQRRLELAHLSWLVMLGLGVLTVAWVHVGVWPWLFTSELRHEWHDLLHTDSVIGLLACLFHFCTEV